FGRGTFRIALRHSSRRLSSSADGCPVATFRALDFGASEGGAFAWAEAAGGEAKPTMRPTTAKTQRRLAGGALRAVTVAEKLDVVKRSLSSMSASLGY